jgi:hypothetical protein
MGAQASSRRFEPDLAQFREIMAAYWRRVLLHGAPALLALLLCVWVFFTHLNPESGLLLAFTIVVGLASLAQLVGLWLERPSMSVNPVAVELGEGFLRFVNDDAGTVEELRWKTQASVRVRRRKDSVEIRLPSGRVNVVQWLAYTNREALLRELMALQEDEPGPRAPPALELAATAASPQSSEPPEPAKPATTVTAEPAQPAEAAKPETPKPEARPRRKRKADDTGETPQSEGEAPPTGGEPRA